MMKQSKIEIVIDHAPDVPVEETVALQEVFRLIGDGMTSGMNRNEDEGFSFTID
ncbi:MAG: hypothetical protein ACJA07_000418 [Rhodococcus sp. (in: high G+C Gram-positive bacteria)]|jgi:hypothetical protein